MLVIQLDVEGVGQVGIIKEGDTLPVREEVEPQTKLGKTRLVQGEERQKRRNGQQVGNECLPWGVMRRAKLRWLRRERS